jgi:hypothetical protein
MQKSKNTWVNTKKKLPEKGKQVLVCVDSYFDIAEIFDYDYLGNPMWTYTGLGSDPEWWMPLPEPPQTMENRKEKL